MTSQTMNEYSEGDHVIVTASHDRCLVGRIFRLYTRRRRREAEMRWYWFGSWFPAVTWLHPAEIIRDMSNRLDPAVDLSKISGKCTVLFLHPHESADGNSVSHLTQMASQRLYLPERAVIRPVYICRFEFSAQEQFRPVIRPSLYEKADEHGPSPPSSRSSRHSSNPSPIRSTDRLSSKRLSLAAIAARSQAPRRPVERSSSFDSDEGDSSSSAEDEIRPTSAKYSYPIAGENGYYEESDVQSDKEKVEKSGRTSAIPTILCGKIDEKRDFRNPYSDPESVDPREVDSDADKCDRKSRILKGKLLSQENRSRLSQFEKERPERVMRARKERDEMEYRLKMKRREADEKRNYSPEDVSPSSQPQAKKAMNRSRPHKEFLLEVYEDPREERSNWVFRVSTRRRVSSTSSKSSSSSSRRESRHYSSSSSVQSPRSSLSSDSYTVDKRACRTRGARSAYVPRFSCRNYFLSRGRTSLPARKFRGRGRGDRWGGGGDSGGRDGCGGGRDRDRDGRGRDDDGRRDREGESWRGGDRWRGGHGGDRNWENHRMNRDNGDWWGRGNGGYDYWQNGEENWGNDGGDDWGGGAGWTSRGNDRGGRGRGRGDWRGKSGRGFPPWFRGRGWRRGPAKSRLYKCADGSYKILNAQNRVYNWKGESLNQEM